MSTPSGETYSDFILGQLDREVKRRETIDARASTVVTSSSVVVTLLVAAIGLSYGKDFQLEGRTELIVTIAAGFFMAATFAAIASSFTHSYQIAAKSTLKSMTTDRWRDSDDVAKRGCAQLNLSNLTTLRRGNKKKGKILTFSLILQSAGVLCSLMTLLLA